ncbi:hypothetical protein EKK58_02560 [Candidatus Dependentiae bacterium]|nr:MAG: hypothetical protein EKK58_02560 [Candidatus Dependentiae bacterium]
MAHISKEEVLKIAAISNIRLLEKEIEPLQRELESVINYAKRVSTIKGDAQEMQLASVNVARKDIVASTDATVFLQGSPEATNNYFIVPLIIDQE